jgi:hypothetical protein
MKKQAKVTRITREQLIAAVNIMRQLDWLMINEIVSYYNRINSVQIKMTLSGYKHCLRNSEKLLIAAGFAERSNVKEFIPAFENLFNA